MSKPPKVMHVISGLHSGGAERMLANLALSQGAGKDWPMVAALIPGGDHYERLKSGNVNVTHLGMKRGRAGPAGIMRLAGLIRTAKPDVIQSWMYHGDLAATLALMISGRRRKTRLFWGLRCSDMDLSRYSALFKFTVRACAGLSKIPDAVTSNSEAGIAWHKALGYRARRYELVENGIDIETYRPDHDARRAVRRELGIAEETPLLITVARVDPMKDYPGLIEAIGMLEGVEAMVVGLNTITLPKTERLHRLGHRTDVPNLLAAADLLVSPSAYGEGFSNAIAEGMAAGLPVIATDVGDARRIVGEAGRIIDPGDPEELAEVIRELTADMEKLHELGATARARIEANYTPARMAARFAEIHNPAPSQDT